MRKQKACRWFDRQIVKATRKTTWQSFFDGKVQISTKWSELYHVGVGATAVYKNTAHSGRQATSKWHVRTKSKIAVLVRFRLRKIAAKVAHVGFEEYVRRRLVASIVTEDRVRVHTTIPASYRTCISVGKNCATSWKDAENPPVTVQTTKWNVKDTASIGDYASWNCADCAGVQAATRWSVQKLHVCCTTGWNCAAKITKKVQAPYRVRLTLNKKQATFWDDYKRLWLVRWARYKVFERAQRVKVQRGVHRPGLLRDALLPNTTKGHLDRKKRFELGIK